MSRAVLVRLRNIFMVSTIVGWVVLIGAIIWVVGR